MKKLITALLTIAVLAILAGCNSESPESVNNNSEISNSSVDDPGSNSGEVSGGNSKPDESVSENDKGESTFLAGPDGAVIYTGEITSVTDGEGNTVSVENVKPGGFSEAVCDGFCYLSEPTGISSNERDEPDRWDGAMHCLEVPEEPLAPSFKRLEVGDTFCGLKITKASSEYYAAETMNFKGSNVEFEGELTLTGYITINSDNTYSVGVGDLQFIIDEKSAVLPGSWDYSTQFASDDYSPFFNYQGFYMGSGKEKLDWYWSVSEYGQLYLGNISTCTADISDIGSRDMCYYKVKVKINNIKSEIIPSYQTTPIATMRISLNLRR